MTDTEEKTENKTTVKKRTPKQMEWSRKLGQMSKLYKEQKMKLQANETIEKKDNNKSDNTVVKGSDNTVVNKSDINTLFYFIPVVGIFGFVWYFKKTKSDMKNENTVNKNVHPTQGINKNIEKTDSGKINDCNDLKLKNIESHKYSLKME